MKIEILTVKLLRSGLRYSNDSTELVVVLEEGDDWKEIEPKLRLEAVELIEAHWKRRAELELEETRRRRELELKERNERAARMRAEGESPCDACDHYHDCKDCPAYEGDDCPI
jgi:hypothetical protein